MLKRRGAHVYWGKGCEWVPDEYPPSILPRYPSCGNNTQVSIALAGRRYAPISNLHGNVLIIRSEKQSTHVLHPASLKLDLRLRKHFMMIETVQICSLHPHIPYTYLLKLIHQ